MKIVQNALFRSCGTRFAQIAFWSVKVLNIVTLASNSLQNGKIVRFPSKLYKTLFWGHAQHVLAKSHFWESKFSESWNWPQILFKTGKQCALHTELYKTHFSGHAQDDSAKSHFGASKFSKLSCRLEILLKTGKQCAFYEKCTKRSFQVMRNTFQSLHWPIVTLASNSLQNGKIVRFSSKFYKTLFWGHVQHVLAKSHFGASKF